MQRSNPSLPPDLAHPEGGSSKPAVTPLAERPPQDIDIASFRHLLDIAGPTTAIELLARLESDLTAVSQSLRLGFATKEWSVLRGQSHILIALAGVVGAKGLHQSGQALNTAAGAKDIGATDRLQASLLLQLADLIHFIAHYPQPSAKIP